MQAMRDQAWAEVRDGAKQIRIIHGIYAEAGFNDDQAFALTQRFLVVTQPTDPKAEEA